jgi:DnaK suppressor protein
MLSQEFLQKITIKLEQEKKDVEEKIKRYSEPEEEKDNPNIEDLAQDAADDIMEEKLLDIHKGILEKIENALGRIKDGTYGRCLECGVEIAEADLEKEPWVEHCAACKK